MIYRRSYIVGSYMEALRYPGTVAGVCARLVEPPAPAAVARAVSELAALGALDVDAARSLEVRAVQVEHISSTPC